MSQEYKLRALLNTNYNAVKYRIQGKSHFQIFLQIYSDTNPSLEGVMFVEYKLHPTFKERVRVSTLRSNNFQVEIIAWGTFEVEVKVGLEGGKFYSFREDIKKVLERVAL